MSTTESTTELPSVDNGVNVAALIDAREAIGGAPQAAQFTWRASAEWVHGTHTTTTFLDFFGVGEEQSHHKSFSVDTDHPPVFAADDNAVTPIEMVMAGLAGCLTAGVASVATNWDIQLRSVRASVEGNMDIHGILGADPDVRNGFSGLVVRYQIDAEGADRQQIEAIIAQSQKRSAVYDIVTNPTNVVVELV